MSSTPIRPDAEDHSESTEEEEKTIRDRLARLDEDKKAAKPWPEVKAQILRQPKPR